MIELQQLTKTYGDKLAVDAISATIRPGVAPWGFRWSHAHTASQRRRRIQSSPEHNRGIDLLRGMTIGGQGRQL